MTASAEVADTPQQDVSATARSRWLGIDGLRGTAVLSVLICHFSALLPRADHPWIGLLDNGWAGVDLFFVISGFLITGILLDAKRDANYFRNFYARRALRIVPLYYGFLIVTLLLRQWEAQPWLWTWTVNYWLPMRMGWAETAWTPWNEMIIPFWSLAVEEQFYLIWPIVVLLLSPRGLMRTCAGVMAGALALRLVLTAAGVHWIAIYMWTPTRADALAAGAMVALLIRRPDGGRRTRRLASICGGIALAAGLATSGGFDPIHHPWLRTWLYSALAIFFAALLFWSIDAASLRGWPRRFYEMRILRMIGRYSYGIYILHLPLMQLTMRWASYDLDRPDWRRGMMLIGLNVIVTAAVAVISYHCYEQRFLRLKRLFPADGADARGKPC